CGPARAGGRGPVPLGGVRQRPAPRLRGSARSRLFELVRHPRRPGPRDVRARAAGAVRAPPERWAGDAQVSHRRAVLEGAGMNIARWADAQLEATGDFDAFVFDGGTYGSAWCHDAVCRLAQAFVSTGIAPGDRVVLVLPNSIEHVLARWAVLRAGAVVVCV